MFLFTASQPGPIRLSLGSVQLKHFYSWSFNLLLYKYLCISFLLFNIWHLDIFYVNIRASILRMNKLFLNPWTTTYLY